MRPAASRIMLVLYLALPVAWTCWRIGQHTGLSDPMPRNFRVEGSSMVPTLFGESRAARCPACRFVWQVEPQQAVVGVNGWNCAHCGGPLSVEPQRDQSLGQRVTIETVSEIEAAGDSIRFGDLVAVRQQGQLHIKRVVGLPGETIELRGPRLLVGSERLEDRLRRGSIRFPLPWVLVDQDDRRVDSRWSIEPNEEDVVGGWSRDHVNTWHVEGSPSTSPWLLYGHRSVDRGHLASPIWDDYPFNVTLSRKLFVVDRLRLRGKSSSAGVCEVAFWREDGNVVSRQTLQQASEWVFDCFDGKPTDDLPVSKQHPVAIRMLSGPGALQGLRIERLIEYRLRPTDDSNPYPIRLGHDQWFVLGDNVPVSVDSRQWGPLSGDQILGRLRRLDSPPRQMVTVLP